MYKPLFTLTKLRPSGARLSLVAVSLLLAALFLSLSLTPAGSAESRRAPARGGAAARLSEDYGRLPLRFESNRGQTSRAVKFLARGSGYTLFLAEMGAVLRLRAAGVEGEQTRSGTLRFTLEGASRKPNVSGVNELQGRSNYLVGADARAWLTGVPAFEKVRYESVYKGIDAVYYGRQGTLEYDFVVAPGADPARIRLRIDGARATRVEENGDLIISADGGDVRQQRPVAYQELDGTRREVPARYVLDRRGRVRFELGDYDRGRTLVIDPVLVYSSYLGGTDADTGASVAVDSAGSAYVAGTTTSIDFPADGPLQAAKSDFNDAFVVKLSPDGKSLVYATYLGGNGDDFGNAVAVDAGGNAYVGGLTASGSFPTTAGSFQTSKDGTADAFLTKLNPLGTGLVYSTFIGGAGSDQIGSVAVDAGGTAYVAGRTDSSYFNRIPGLKRAGSPAYISTDVGASWGASASGLTASSVFEFAVAPSASNVVYAASNIGVYKSTDGGTNWQLAGQSRTSTAPFFTRTVVVDPSDPSVVYAGTTGGFGVYKSTDGGTLFEGKNSGLLIPVVNTLVINPAAPTTLFAGTPNGIFKTTNGGETWAEVRGGLTGASPNVNVLLIDPSNPQIVYAATTNRGVLKSTDGGANWVGANSGLTQGSSMRQLRALVLDPANPSTLYVSVLNFPGGIFKSTDGGASWTSSSGGLTSTFNGQIFTVGVNAILVDPSGTLFAATNGFGVYKSTDGGANWAPTNAGLPNRNLQALASRPGSPAAVLAGAQVGGDPYVMKLNPAGTFPEYVRMLGGSEEDAARSVALGPNGSAYVVGSTASPDFPAVNARQPTPAGSTDAFVVKLDSGGNTVYSTFLGGSFNEQATGVAVGADGSAYVTGGTSSNDFPLANAFKTTLGTGDQQDAFVTKFSPDGQTLAYSTYLGGANIELGTGIAVGADGSAHVVGQTSSQDFPVAGTGTAHAGFADAFITILNPNGSALLYSTCFGGTDSEQASGVALDGAGGIYLAGTTSSTNLPVPNAAHGTYGGGRTDAFVAKFGVESDLSVSITESRDPVMVGNPLSYTLAVGNAGPSPATGVSLTFTLPAALTYVSAAPTQGSCGVSAQVVTCALGALPESGGASVVVNVNPNANGNAIVTAAVTADESDRAQSNNSDSETTKVSASPSIRGRVTAPGGAALAGVTVTLSGSQSASRQTGADGLYQFEELPAGGNYVVTPSKDGVSFEPPARTFNSLGADQTADFAGTTCSWTLSPPTQSFGAPGGTGTLTVNTIRGCPWTAASNSDWITINSGASGSDTGTVSFTVAPTSAPRAGRLTVAGQNFPVYQELNSCGLPAFTKASYNVHSSGPTLADTADLNGDGYADVVISTNAITGGVTASVMINDGSGHFTSSAFDIGLGGPQGLAVADFNGDARPDLAMWSYVTPYVRILYNNGSGGFGQSAANVEVGSNVAPRPRGVIAADVNRDGKNDLVVSTPDTNNIRILLGDGAGGFTAATPVPVGTGNAQYEMLELADVNGDGKLDLLLGNGFIPRKIVARLGDGAGGFGADIVSNVETYPTNLLTGDFDGDANLDLVYTGAVCDNSGVNCTGAIFIFAGDGAGHFTQKGRLDNANAFSLAVADFNSDGKLDVMQRSQATGEPLLRPGDGLGGFMSPPPAPPKAGDAQAAQVPATGAGALATADFDKDGRPDLALADYDLGAHVYTNRCASAPTISGRVTDQVGLGGVTVTLSGAQAATTQTDAGGNYFFGGLTPGASYVVTPSKESYRFSPASAAINSLPAAGQRADFTATPMTVRLVQFSYIVDENINTLKIDVQRTGDTTGPATVNYSTGPSSQPTSASDRSDYTYAAGTLVFAPNETTKSFTVLLNDDRILEGWEDFTVTLSDPVGAILGSTASAVVNIRDNEFSTPTTNPIDESHIFVRQHYHDFLNREPDQTGIEFWTWEIEQCGADQQCREVKRINVSAAFFLSIEFQQTGYLVYKTYKAAFNTGEALAQKTFLKDTQQIGLGLVVGAPNWEQKLDANKRAYLNAFVQRPDFVAAYPAAMTAAEFVDKLNANTGGALAQGERDALVTSLASGTATRGETLRAVVENVEFSRREFNKAFVLTQYYGYLRRGPSESPDSDFVGYNFWLGKLNEFNGNFVRAEMVKGFIASLEYRKRFGPQ